VGHEVKDEISSATFDILERMARDYPFLKGGYARATNGVDIDLVVSVFFNALMEERKSGRSAPDDSGYQTKTTTTPPVIRQIDGALFIEIIFGEQTFRAPVGNGQYFFSQVVAKLVDPALRAAYPRPPETFARMDNRVAPFASPND
jgi:hypothetical protein